MIKVDLFLMRLLLTYLLLLHTTSWSQVEPSTCKNVRLADIGWTDVTSTTAVAAELLEALHYEPKISVVSMPVAFAGLKNNDLDVFLGNWMPSQEADVRPYLNDKSLVQVHKNLEHARYTLAVPEYVYDAGVRTFADLNSFADKFSKRIYGIEPGNDGNRLILKMIKDNSFHLAPWQIVESSEQGMLVAVKQAVAYGDWIVFLGWAPHPMNLAVKMKYLSGGDAYFGPNMGDSTVFTTIRRGYAEACPNLAKLWQQLTFSVDIENQIMSYIIDDQLSPKAAAQKWLGNNAEVAISWLAGVSTAAGESGVEAFKKHLFTINNFSANKTLAKIPLGDWIESAVVFLTAHFSEQFRYFSESTEWGINELVKTLLKIPAMLLLLLISALVYFWHRSIALSLMVLLGFLVILNLGLWVETMQTLVLVLLASFLAVMLGIPLGVFAAWKPWFYALLRPLLDLMQTIPTFVYLIPTLMLFGLGMVPGLISTLIFAIAVPIRLTYLGIKSVPLELIEASEAFGATPMQRLFKVEIPYAMPSILAGFTQCIMLSLSMVVIAALVGAEGLGTPVVRALNTVNIKQGFESGLAIVILAVLLDRTLNVQRKQT